MGWAAIDKFDPKDLGSGERSGNRDIKERGLGRIFNLDVGVLIDTFSWLKKGFFNENGRTYRSLREDTQRL